MSNQYTDSLISLISSPEPIFGSMCSDVANIIYHSGTDSNDKLFTLLFKPVLDMLAANDANMHKLSIVYLLSILTDAELNEILGDL